MPDGFFKEDCPLKHFIRLNVWLPRCREQRQALATIKPSRRLKYFTFCAVGALDVLLLDRERVIRRSRNDEFDTVFFFDHDDEAVAETRLRIPGAHGFPGNFIEVMLDTPSELDLAKRYLELEENTLGVRRSQRYLAQRQQFISEFPFDVVNLDVEEFLYKEKEQLPGRLTAAIRQLFTLQRNEGTYTDGNKYSVNEFILLFTTQVGPPGMANQHREYLCGCIESNIKEFEEVKELFSAISNGRDPRKFFEEDFDAAFKLSVPKSLSELAWEEDWYIDSRRGIEVFEFLRDSNSGPYCMLHMAMTVRRQDPPRDKRGPGQVRQKAEEEHREVVKRIFSNHVFPELARRSAMASLIIHTAKPPMRPASNANLTGHPNNNGENAYAMYPAMMMMPGKARRHVAPVAL